MLKLLNCVLSTGKVHELYPNEDVEIYWECPGLSSNLLDPKLTLREAALLPQEMVEKCTAAIRVTITIDPQREGSDWKRPLCKGLGYLWTWAANTTSQNSCQLLRGRPAFPRDPAITCQLQEEAKADELGSLGILSSLVAPLGLETGQVPGSMGTGKVLRPFTTVWGTKTERLGHHPSITTDLKTPPL